MPPHASRRARRLGAPNRKHVFGAQLRRGAHCAPRGRCGYAPQAHKRRGEPHGSPCLLRITTPSFRARCARKSKSLFPVAARLPQRVSETDAAPEAGAQCAPLRRAERCVPVGWNLPFLLLGANGWRKLWRYAPCARSAPLFAAANAANLRADTYVSALAQRNGVDSQEGENLWCSPSCAQCGRAGRKYSVMN